MGYAQADLVVPLGRFTDLEQANTAARSWCAEVNAALHTEIAAIPAERLVAEAEHLRPLPELRSALLAGVVRKVDRLACVRLGSARYSCPTPWVGAQVLVAAEEGQIVGTTPRVSIERQNYRGELKRLKSSHSRRTIPLSAGMVATLRERRARSYAGEHVPVFTTKFGQSVDARNLRRRVLDKATGPLGLEWVSFHTFRHTCASLLFAGGKDVKQVQEWLGHADPGFTLRTYVHLLDEGLGSADFLDAVVTFSGSAVGSDR